MVITTIRPSALYQFLYFPVRQNTA